MSGIRWDWKSNPNDFNNEIYVRKVDSSGIFTRNDEIKTKATSMEINYYPNPANHWLTVEYAPKSPIRKGGVEIFDLLGQPVYSSCISEKLVIDVSFLSQGIYFLKVMDNGEKYKCQTAKLLIE